MSTPKTMPTPKNTTTPAMIPAMMGEPGRTMGVRTPKVTRPKAITDGPKMPHTANSALSAKAAKTKPVSNKTAQALSTPDQTRAVGRPTTDIKTKGTLPTLTSGTKGTMPSTKPSTPNVPGGSYSKMLGYVNASGKKKGY